MVSPDITHKTEARGVRIVARELGAVEAAFELMLREVPEAYATYLEAHEGHLPAGVAGFSGALALPAGWPSGSSAILLCRCVEPDAGGFATELFVGLRATDRVRADHLGRPRRGGDGDPGPGHPQGRRGCHRPHRGRGRGPLLRAVPEHPELPAAVRRACAAPAPLVDDDTLIECFQAFIDTRQPLLVGQPGRPLHLVELEVNPFSMPGGKMAPLDGVCSFRPAAAPAPPRPLHKIAHLLRPRSAAVIGVSEKGMNMGRIILGQPLRRRL